MAADSDGCDLTAVVTCEGDLSDPRFAERFEAVVGELNAILGEEVKVRKLEPWNSVRVTLSIPREAALRLRKLASEGAAQLRSLGILSVQVEGDQVISLRIANALNAEPQEIRLTTVPDGSGGSQEAALSRLLAPEPEKVQFKSPNVVCPSDSVVPKVAVSTSAASSAPPSKTSFAGPFPFTSMNQAIHGANYAPPPTAPPPPPPPYPGNKHPAVTISSPLLVNLLQNDGKEAAASAVKPRTLAQKPRTIANRVPVNTKLPQASTSSPSALSTSTSIRQNSKPNSTTLPPPPPYSVAVTTRQWDSVVQSAPFLDLTPSLKADDLEHLLPTLERELARSPPEIPEELTRPHDKRNFLINPLTGELEPQSSGESDAEPDLGDVFTGLPSPAALSDDDTNSTIRPDTATDQSDSETRSSHSDSGRHSRKSKAARDRGRDSPGPKPATEKIKLRLKLEKSEPISAAYKVDVSFIQQPKKASAAAATPPPPPTGEELRVPPLHISLRGRHHAFITNKKKKLNPDKPKASKAKKEGATSDDDKKKKFKANHEHDATDLVSKLVIHGYKEKQKERRGSDSELSRANLKFADSNGIISVEKKRRLSQSEAGGMGAAGEPPVLGSTNVGTIAGLPQKPRKDKNKVKDVFKSKDMMRNKGFSKACLGEKFTKQVALPTGEIDMEAKFKQRLMEGTEKGIPRPPHRTDVVHQSVVTESNQMEKSDQVLKVESDPLPLVEKSPKSPEPDKCNTPERKPLPPDLPLGDKQSGRSPNSGAQGEDSGIESMDALSEKSPNQASQSPHADIPEPPPAAVTASAASGNGKSKTQVPEMPDMLDIEAQLAKMEGLNGVEDMNENRTSGGGGQAKKQMTQCCELTSALQDSLKQGAVSLSTVAATSPMGVKEQLQPADVTMVPLKAKTKDEDLEPLPVRVTPPLYTYSNPEKARAGSESPALSDDSNSCAAPVAAAATSKTKSLLEQLLIEIPEAQTPSSPSPATRSSVRTRALSKLSSPELSSPVAAPPPAASKAVRAVVTPPVTGAAAKRKRNESDSSNNGVDDARNKKTRKCSENAAELIKACMGVDVAKVNNVKKVATGKPQDESSDSDEPLIEKVRKTTAAANSAANNVAGKKVKGLKGAVTTRRSVRTAPTPNTRSKGDKVADSEAIRRKTRSAVSEVDSKRKKEIK